MKKRIIKLPRLKLERQILRNLTCVAPEALARVQGGSTEPACSFDPNCTAPH
jgi:hypothetical protein